MQQLISFDLQPEGDIILLEVASAPHWDAFEQWAENLAQHYGFSVQECIRGADRAQLLFYTHAGNFLLCYEWLSDSCWIEAMAGDGKETLMALHNAMLER